MGWPSPPVIAIRMAVILTALAFRATIDRPDRFRRSRDEWPDTLHRHQTPARWLDTNLVEHTLGESIDFSGHHVALARTSG